MYQSTNKYLTYSNNTYRIQYNIQMFIFCLCHTLHAYIKYLYFYEHHLCDLHFDVSLFIVIFFSA